jgi:hypothetical protein
MRAVNTHLLVENETLVEVRVSELSSLLLDDLDVVEVGRTLCVENEQQDQFAAWREEEK